VQGLRRPRRGRSAGLQSDPKARVNFSLARNTPRWVQPLRWRRGRPKHCNGHCPTINADRRAWHVPLAHPRKIK
jgi:hypothetical protein